MGLALITTDDVGALRLWVGGVTLPLALANRGLIDEYEFLVQPVLAGHGPTLLAGLHDQVRLELVDCREFRSGRSPYATGLRASPSEVVHLDGPGASVSRRADEPAAARRRLPTTDPAADEAHR